MQTVKSGFQQKPLKLKPLVLMLVSSFCLSSVSCFAQAETGDSASPAPLMAPQIASETVPESLPQIIPDPGTQFAIQPIAESAPAPTTEPTTDPIIQPANVQVSDQGLTHAADKNTVSTPDQHQSMDQLATEDLTAASTLVQRLQPYVHSDAVWTRYQAQKARMWLLYASTERNQRGITQAAAQAEAEAVKLLEQLESNQSISATTPIIASSKVLRRDLWVTAELLKQQPGFDCAADELAQAEVTLVWAAAEHCELGWRHSRELFAAAERLVDGASYQAASCHAASQSVAATPLARVSYPSLAELNGNQKGCHGVVGQWPIIAGANPAADSQDTTNPASPAAAIVIVASDPVIAQTDNNSDSKPDVMPAIQQESLAESSPEPQATDSSLHAAVGVQ